MEAQRVEAQRVEAQRVEAQRSHPGAVGGGPAGWGAAGTAVSGLLGSGGAVFTETGGRAPRALLRRLACDSAVTRIVFGPDGAVLDVGRAQRTVTGQMRRAVIARDEHCVYPGCDQPPSRCEVHHAVRHWADGGDTSVANSALLCWYHHQLVDARGIVMHWTGKPTTGAGTPVPADRCPGGDRVGLHRRPRPPHPPTPSHRHPTLTRRPTRRPERGATSRRSRLTDRHGGTRPDQQVLDT